jgi:hypothetical protein
MNIPKNEIEFVNQFYCPDYDRPHLPFGKIAEKWQYEIFCYPILEKRIERVYIEMARDTDKSGLTAALMVAACFYKPGLIVRIFAVDADQASVLRDSIEARILRPHPELKIDIELQARTLKFANGSKIVIEAADASSSFGKQADICVIDEFHCWKSENSKELYNSLASKGRSKIVILTNAGSARAGLCWETREKLRAEYDRDPRGWVYWYSGEAEPFLPSWITPERLERRRAELPPGVFKRLHLCQWGAGGDLFTQEHIEACRRFGLSYVMSDPDGGGVLGLDFGRVKDWTAGTIVKNVCGSIVLLNSKTWKGTHKNPVKTATAQEYAEAGFRDFGLSKAVIESWQMASVCEQLMSRYGSRVVEFKPSAQSVAAMSQTFYDLVTAGALNFPPDPGLERELLELEAEETGIDKTQFKIVYRRHSGGMGHGDRGRAIMMAAYFAAQERPARPLEEVLEGIACGAPRMAEEFDLIDGDRRQGGFSLEDMTSW